MANVLAARTGPHSGQHHLLSAESFSGRKKASRASQTDSPGGNDKIEKAEKVDDECPHDEHVKVDFSCPPKSLSSSPSASVSLTLPNAGLIFSKTFTRYS